MKKWQAVFCAVVTSTLLLFARHIMVDRAASGVGKVTGHEIELTENMNQPPEHVDVFVVLHSHVDPGWLLTFDQYYDSKVHDILNNVVEALDQYEALRFIWSEVSFLERWWSFSNDSNRARLIRLIGEGRFEVTGGSWVMTDEATTYFWSTIDNMIVGHQFLLKRLKVLPRTSWSVDPFGHGSTVPYLLSLSGINEMVIGRINAMLKERMKEFHRLHYKWVQPWDTELKWAPTVNVLPRTYYTTTDACGPDPSICCKFDVAITARSICNERATADPKRVAEYAELMAEQYRQLQPYYNSPSVLVAAGDDFAYADPKDLPTVYRVYSALFSYINSVPQFNMTVKFGTISEYFNSLKGISLPLLSGDFFPYLDNPDGPYGYWTGFYNQRPYHKRLERIVESKLRALDLLTIAAKAHDISIMNEIARRDLALFQHHDAITGTSERPVMFDYFNRLSKSLDSILMEQEKFISQLQGDSTENRSLSSVDARPTVETFQLLPQNVIRFNRDNERLYLTIFNQNSFRSRQLLTVQTNTPNITVLYNGVEISAQIGPLFVADGIDKELFTLSFYMTLDAFVLTRVEMKKQSKPPSLTKPSTLGFSDDCQQRFSFPNYSLSETLKLKNTIYSLKWNALQDGNDVLKLQDFNENIGFNLRFSELKDSGGAYVMSTDGTPLKPLQRNNSLETYMVSGELYSTIYQRISPQLSYALTIMHQRNSSAKCIYLQIWPNVTCLDDVTIMMHIETALNNSDLFYTDVNGLHLMQKRYNDARPLEANIYPMPSAAMIEDERLRLTLLSGQPTGVTSSTVGNLDVMIDRRQIGDDGKGMGFGEASESYPSELKYRIVVEKRDQSSNDPTLYHSSTVQRCLDELLYPPSLFIDSIDSQKRRNSSPPSISLFPPLPCNIQLVNMRYLSEDFIIIILRRLPFDCDIVSQVADCDDLNNDLLSSFFAFFRGRIFEMNLTGTIRGAEVGPIDIAQRLSTPLEIHSFGVQTDQFI
uniref:Alpha-mannosidase n=1 Tax=Ascaris lumbricoides TaxID=6252 RepID=A0A0M3HYE4_ASCLU